MNRENITDKDIVQFLEYHNRPDWFGMYNKIQEGHYPIYKLNLEEHQLWLMIADFFSTYQIENKEFSHDTDFFRTAIKIGWTERVSRLLTGKKAARNDMTVAFLTATARHGIWNERINDASSQLTGRHSIS